MSDDVVLSSALGRYLLRDLIRRHPLPWIVEQDWTLEIYDRDHDLVLKLPHGHPEAGELMEAAAKLAKLDGLNREPLPCADDEHTCSSEDRELSVDLWEAVDPVCTACGWRSSEIEERKNSPCGYTGQKNCKCKECTRRD